MLQSGLAKHLVEADILLFIEAKRVLVTRCFAMLSSFLVGIHSFRLKGVRLGRTPGLAERGPLSDKTQFVGQRYTSLLSGDNKNPRRRISARSFQNFPKRFPGPGRFPMQYYNRFGAKKSRRCGLERTLVWKRFTRLYIAAERNFSLFGDLNL